MLVDDAVILLPVNEPVAFIVSETIGDWTLVEWVMLPPLLIVWLLDELSVKVDEPFVVFDFNKSKVFESFVKPPVGMV